MHKSVFLSVYSLSIAFSYAKHLGKGWKLALIFVHVWTGHAPFHSKEFVIPGSLGGQLCYFSAVLQLYGPLGKAFNTFF